MPERHPKLSSDFHVTPADTANPDKDLATGVRIHLPVCRPRATRRIAAPGVA